MSGQSTTIELQEMLGRFAAGDAAAKEALVARALERLTTIARKLLRGFGGEKRVELWSAEVISEAYPRIAKAMDDVKPTSVPQFLGLARLQMQRALLDHVRGLEGRGGTKPPRPLSISGKSPQDDDGRAFEIADPDDERHRMLVLDLLEAVAKLPENEAETVWLKLAGYSTVRSARCSASIKTRSIATGTKPASSWPSRWGRFGASYNRFLFLPRPPLR